MNGLILAIHTLTILRITSKDIKGELSDSLYWFPVIGLFIGLILYSICWLWNLLGFPDYNLLISLFIVLTEIILTAALHIDGLSDWADSFGTFEKEEKLKIMKDPHAGTFGVVAISIDIVSRIILISAILELKKNICVILTPVISRTMMIEMCIGMPYARKTDGTGAPFINGAKTLHRIISFFLCMIICIMLYGIKGIYMFFIALFATFLLKWDFKKRFGGLTGDLLGTTNEIITVLSLFTGLVV